MALFNIVKEVLLGFLQGLSEAWWVEVTTESPRCIYYFGPFDNSVQASRAISGYLEDLESEGSEGIKFIVKRCNPDVLTLCSEEVD